MANDESDVLSVDSHTLRYAGKVIPLRNIAYFEKFKIKKNKGFGKILFVTILTGILAAVGSANVPRRDAGGVIAIAVIFLGVVYLGWIIFLLFRRSEYALVLQTNAGDLPRLFTTDDEKFLDDLIKQLAIRLESGKNLPPLIANIRNSAINFGDQIMGDKFENIQNSTIINRSIVEDAIKTVQASRGTDVAEALETIAKAVEESRSVAAGALFDSFSKELQKKQPNKSALRQFWEGLTQVVPSISTLAEAAAKIVTLFA